MTTNINIEIGARLHAARQALGISQPDMARRLSVSQVVLASWEVGRTTLPMLALKALADEFGIRPNYLILGDKNALPDDLRDKV